MTCKPSLSAHLIHTSNGNRERSTVRMLYYSCSILRGIHLSALLTHFAVLSLIIYVRISTFSLPNKEFCPVCTYIYTYTYISYMHIHTHIYIHIIHAHTYTHTYISYMHIHTHIYIHIIHAHTYTHIHTYHTCTYIHTYTYISYMHIHTHIYIHINWQI